MGEKEKRGQTRATGELNTKEKKFRFFLMPFNVGKLQDRVKTDHVPRGAWGVSNGSGIVKNRSGRRRLHKQYDAPGSNDETMHRKA